MNVLVKVYCHCSKVQPTALCRLAGFLSTGKDAFTCDSGTRFTPSVGAELIATPTAVPTVHEQLREHAAGRVTDQDRRSLEPPDDPFESLHDLLHRQLFDRGRSAFSASTSTSKPGYAGASTVKPFFS